MQGSLSRAQQQKRTCSAHTHRGDEETDRRRSRDRQHSIRIAPFLWTLGHPIPTNRNLVSREEVWLYIFSQSFDPLFSKRKIKYLRNSPDDSESFALFHWIIESLESLSWFQIKYIITFAILGLNYNILIIIAFMHHYLTTPHACRSILKSKRPRFFIHDVESSFDNVIFSSSF